MVVRTQRAQGAKTEKKKLNKRLAKWWWPICIRENFIHCHASSAFHILKKVENFVRETQRGFVSFMVLAPLRMVGGNGKDIGQPLLMMNAFRCPSWF